MKKLIAIAAIALSISTTTHAQVDTRRFVISLAPEASLPIGKFKETNKFSAGGSIVTQFYLAEKLRVLASIGGILYQGKEYTADWGLYRRLSFRSTLVIQKWDQVLYF